MAQEINSYWIAYFSHGVVKKWIVFEGESIDFIIKNYMMGQNKGEAKSDKIYFQSKKQITKEQFNI